MRLTTRRLAMFLACAWCGASYAANYDARVTAPRAPNASALRAAISEYQQLYARLGPDGVLRDRTVYQKRTHAEWLFKQAVDDGTAGDLTEFGWLRGEDGAYSVKLQQFPQWRHFDAWLQLLNDPGFLSDSGTEELRQRGFREQDLSSLRQYLETHSLTKDVAQANAPLTREFAQRVRADASAKRSTDHAKVRSYIYQTERATDEARRAWAVGLLDALDTQRQRILVSHYLDTPGGRSISPQPDSIDGLKKYVELLNSGEIERHIERQLAGGRQP